MHRHFTTNWPKPLEVVFLTNFSEPCFRTIPAIAQMADDIALQLTIVHAYDPNEQRHEQAETGVHSFFPEADRYGNTRRLTLPGTPLEVLRRVAQDQPVDLVVCPASDLMGLPRLGHHSLRARILRDLGLPLWTVGRGAQSSRLGKAVRNVACWVDFETEGLSHVGFATEYASKLKARLHLFYALPEIHDGFIASRLPARPLHADGVRKFFREMLAEAGIEPEIHVSTRSSRRVQTAMATAHEADILFTSVRSWSLGPWVFSGFREIDRHPCPVVCMEHRSNLAPWRLEPGAGLNPWCVENAIRSPRPITQLTLANDWTRPRGRGPRENMPPRPSGKPSIDIGAHPAP